MESVQPISHSAYPPLSGDIKVDGVLKFKCVSDELIQLEKKNKDLKIRLPILVEYALDSWSEKLPSVRFTLHSPKTDNTGHTAAYLHFGCQLWTIDDVVHDLKDVLDNDIVTLFLRSCCI
ncbi:hypothetical protein CEXT_352541 [Caerostris extrusa]|uniref:Uncharacterized protein n=1 Tax=Caerostris extrusa TaxID=172846 RepID=A0AAV4NY79_CAEEX|nr:hypothetical protein CEXT_352541 [Caerostris extrusa]